MADNILKEFLIGIGFSIDDQSHARFTAAIATTTDQLTTFAKAAETAALAVVASVKTMADQFENLYFASKRLGATIEGLRTFGMTVERLGGSVQGAMSSLESFRATLQSNPGTRGILQSLGVNPDGSTEKVVEDLGAALKRLNDPMRARQIGALFGLGWDTTLAVMSGEFARINQEKTALDARMGITPKWAEDAAKHAHVFNDAYTKVIQVFTGLKDKITDVVEQRLTRSISEFTDMFLENFDRIQTIVGKITEGFGWFGSKAMQVIGDIATAFGQVYDWYSKLDPATTDFVNGLLKIAAAYYVLDKVLSGSPWAIALKAAIGGVLLLLNDYETYLKDPTKAELPWGKIIPVLEEIGAKIRAIARGFNDISESILGQSGVKTAFEALIALLAYRLVGGTLGGLIGGIGVAAGATAGAAGGLGGLLLRALPFLGPTAAFIAGLWPKTIDPNKTEEEMLKRYKNATPDEQRKMLEQRSDIPTMTVRPEHEKAAETVLEKLGLGGAGQWLRDGVGAMGDTLKGILHALENALIPGAHAETVGSGDQPDISMPMGNFGPRPPPTTSAATRERARALMARLQNDLGITAMSAAIAAGNAIAESGVRSIPTGLVPQTNRSAFGIFQWTGDRRIQRDQFAAAHPGLSPEEADIQFFEYDLKTRYPQLLERMKQGTRQFQAMALDFTKNYEGPPAQDVAGHIEMARQLLNEPGLLGPRAVPSGGSSGQQGTTNTTTQNLNSHATASINVSGVHDPRQVSQLIIDEWDRHHLESIRNAAGGSSAW